MRKLWIKSLALVLGISLFTRCSDDSENNNGGSQEPTTISGIVERDARFSILRSALERTGLDATLDSESEATLFAPTNAAFSDLFAELQVANLNELESNIGNEALKRILLYHVLNQAVASADVNAGYIETFSLNTNGNYMMAYIATSGGLRINDRAGLEQADIDATNGVVHALNKVLLPATLYDLIIANPNLSSLDAALQASSGLVATLSGSSRYTLFAPDNQAFDNLIADYPNVSTLNELVAELGPTDLTNTLLYHALNGETLAENLTTGPNTTALGTDVIIDADGLPIRLFDNSGLTSGPAIVTTTNVVASNGVMHIMDAVLLP